jgi:hypothetical protein
VRGVLGVRVNVGGDGGVILAGRLGDDRVQRDRQADVDADCVWHEAREKVRNGALTCGSAGSRDWTRTSNPSVNSRMLCQLSYAGSR